LQKGNLNLQKDKKSLFLNPVIITSTIHFSGRDVYRKHKIIQDDENVYVTTYKPDFDIRYVPKTKGFLINNLENSLLLQEIYSAFEKNETKKDLSERDAQHQRNRGKPLYKHKNIFIIASDSKFLYFKRESYSNLSGTIKDYKLFVWDRKKKTYMEVNKYIFQQHYYVSEDEYIYSWPNDTILSVFSKKNWELVKEIVIDEENLKNKDLPQIYRSRLTNIKCIYDDNKFLYVAYKGLRIYSKKTFELVKTINSYELFNHKGQEALEMPMEIYSIYSLDNKKVAIRTKNNLLIFDIEKFEIENSFLNYEKRSFLSTNEFIGFFDKKYYYEIEIKSYRSYFDQSSDFFKNINVRSNPYCLSFKVVNLSNFTEYFSLTIPFASEIRKVYFVSMFDDKIVIVTNNAIILYENFIFSYQKINMKRREKLFKITIRTKMMKLDKLSEILDFSSSLELLDWLYSLPFNINFKVKGDEISFSYTKKNANLNERYPDSPEKMLSFAIKWLDTSNEEKIQNIIRKTEYLDIDVLSKLLNFKDSNQLLDWIYDLPTDIPITIDHNEVHFEFNNSSEESIGEMISILLEQYKNFDKKEN